MPKLLEHPRQLINEKVTGVFADGFVLAIHTTGGVLVLDCNRRSGCTRDDIGQLVPAKKDIENEAFYDWDALGLNPPKQMIG